MGALRIATFNTIIPVPLGGERTAYRTGLRQFVYGMPFNISPQEFGRLEALVEQLDKQLERTDATLLRMSHQIDQLMGMANKSKGAFWAAMTLASAAGSVITFIFSHWGGKP